MTMMMTGLLMKRPRHRCLRTSTSLNTAIGCGFHDGRPHVNSLPPLLVMARLYVWWVGWPAWSSGGDCTRTSRGPVTCPHSPTYTSSSSASSQCGRILPTLMEGNGWCDSARRRRGVRGKISAWRCWASSLWLAPSYAGSCSQYVSRRTTWRCGTGRRRTRWRRATCATRCAASCSCRPPCPSSTRRTATACGPPPRAPPSRTARPRRSRRRRPSRAPSATPCPAAPAPRRQPGPPRRPAPRTPPAPRPRRSPLVLCRDRTHRVAGTRRVGSILKLLCTLSNIYIDVVAKLQVYL